MGTRSDPETELIDAATGHAVIATDADGAVVVFSRGAEILLGFSRDEVLGEHVGRLLDDAAELDVAPAGRPDANDVGQDDLDAGPPPAREWTLRRRDGTAVPALVVVTRRPAAVGARAGHLYVATSMGVGREAERALDELVGRIAHDLRTPLTSVLGFAQLLDSESLTDEQRRHVAAIERNGQRLLHLIDELQAGNGEPGTTTWRERSRREK